MATSEGQARTGAARTRTNLVPPLGRFVGRSALLEAIDAHVKRGERLITLLGAPGMGKTRLALRYAETCGGPFLQAGGVWICDLTEASDVTDMCAAIAKTLGLRLAPELEEEAVVEQVGDAVAGAGPVLLVLDNFEQLVEDAARTVERWCAVASEARVLVTSRTRLGVLGERILDLPPLGLPLPGESDEARLSSEAAMLFRERAMAVGGWRDAQSSASGAARDVAALVRELEGIPLAIELAAARSQVLSPEELLARISERRGDILSSGAREGRHATLRAAIDWSWNLLTGAEQIALAECGVFSGDFSLDAAERIIDLSSEFPAPAVIDVLAALCDKSLVRSRPGDLGRATRFSLYSSIRDYARERARARGNEEATRARHRRYYVETARPWAEKHARTGDAASFAALSEVKDQLLAIQRDLRSRSALTDEEASHLARAVLSLEPVASTEALFEELLSMLGAGIDAASQAKDEPLRGCLLLARGNAYGLRGEAAACLRDLDAARDLGRACGDALVEAEALVMAGVRYRQQGLFEKAWTVGQEASALLEATDHPRLQGTNQAVLGLLLSELGRAEESREHNLRARSILHASGDRWAEALAVVNLAQLDHAAGDFEQAAHGYHLGLERFRESGDRRFEGRYLGLRAGLALEQGDTDTARALFATALEVLSVVRSWHIEGITRAAFGALEAMTGHAREAMTELDRATALLTTRDAPAFLATVEVHRGQLDLLFAREAAARGDGDRAEKLLAQVRSRIEAAPHVETSGDVRFAVRLLERELARVGAPRSDADLARPRLDVGPGALWFRIGESPAVDLGRRAALRLLLEGLVERRLEAPGAATSWPELLAVGWPGERVLAGAGATRVRVAVSTLRRMGLAGVLVTREEGYALDPRAPIRRANHV